MITYYSELYTKQKENRALNYTEYRSHFKTVEEFNRAFGQLSEEEAEAFISAGNYPTFIKACMITAWSRARQEYLKKRSGEKCKTDIRET